MNPQEGYVKFGLQWREAPSGIPDSVFEHLERWRSVLYDMGAVGAHPDGIGFGNLSRRAPTDPEGGQTQQVRFYITGSATGTHRRLSKDHYALVTGYSLEENRLECVGSTKASSESLSHAAIYEAVASAEAVVHVHHRALWERQKGVLPTTAASIEYGTPEMALALKDLAGAQADAGAGVIVMGGHEEGVIAFGPTLAEAASAVRDLIAEIEEG